MPPTLSDAGIGGRKRAAHVQEYLDGESPPFEFPSHWRKPDVRGALYAMQWRVCAYCGADIEEAGIDVEHFRPKGKVDGETDHVGYWWLAYEFENYLLSCTICNQRNKRTVFPIVDGTERVSYEERNSLNTESRVLLNPTLDAVESLFYFDWTSTSGKIGPHPGLTFEENTRVTDTVALFRVNKKAAQRRKRLAIQRFVIQKVEQGLAEDARELAIRFRPHSLVAKQILEDNAPQALPTPEQELAWLIEVITSDLVFKLEDLEDKVNVTETDEDEAKELLWALATLWRDPPTGTAEMVAQMLEQRELKDIVRGYFEQLA